MSRVRIRFFAVGAALLVLLVGYLSLNRTVTVLADGQAITVVTRALTVRGALSAAGLEPGPQDQVEPGPFAILRNDLVINLERASLVEIEADGETYRLIRAERGPVNLLAEVGITLGDNDRLILAGQNVSIQGDLPSVPMISLKVLRAVSVTLQGDESRQFESSAPTLGQALSEQGINLTNADQLEPSAETALTEPITVTLMRAQPLEIVLGDETISMETAATTVGDALAEAGISLQGLDRSEPAEDQAIPTDRSIRVVRVIETVTLEQESIAHQTEWQADDEAELDTTSVVQLGQDGVVASRLRVRLEDGEEISRQEEGERVLVEPQTQINGYGTKIVLRTIVVDGVTIEYYRAISVRVTSYSPCRSGVSGCLNGTASGLPVERGTVATYLSWYRELKFATIYVPGYGIGTIGDTGAYPTGEPWIDLAYSDADFVAWPANWVTIYFTTPVPAYVPPIWPP